MPQVVLHGYKVHSFKFFFTFALFSTRCWIWRHYLRSPFKTLVYPMLKGATVQTWHTHTQTHSHTYIWLSIASQSFNLCADTLRCWCSGPLPASVPLPSTMAIKTSSDSGVERRIASPTRCRSRRKKMPIYCLFPFADSFAVARSFSCCCCCTSQKLQWQIHGNGHLPLSCVATCGACQNANWLQWCPPLSPCKPIFALTTTHSLVPPGGAALASSPTMGVV